MKKLVFYRCNHCGNVVVKLVDSKVPVFCCGEPMQELKANTTDAAQEKHVPCKEVNNGTVTIKVGSTLHPMSQEHYIQFVAMQTNKNVYIKYFEPTDEPICSFHLTDGEEVEDIYAYCNLHSLWKL